MTVDLEDFRQRLLAHSKVAVMRVARCDNEAKTNAYLVQPFLAVLGYDVGNPDEVSPEHHADFSEKYQNKVDYAILSNGSPVIAVESKRTGSTMKDDRGQLRSYFNACPTVKLGILTDGIKFELYADSDKPNMMDEFAFIRLDLEELAKNATIDDNTLGGIAAIRSGLFNPQDVGAEAKRKILFESIVSMMRQMKTEPTDDFIRFVLTTPTVGSKIGKVTQKVVDANREGIQTAMEAFVAQEALSRFGFSPKDVMRAAAEAPTSIIPVLPPPVAEPEIDGAAPSDRELAAFEYAKNRLFFLVKEEALFSEVSKIAIKKNKNSMRVFLHRPNNGSIFDYREPRSGAPILQFPGLENVEIEFTPSAKLDDCLLKAFKRRIVDGSEATSKPAMRVITGGANPAST